MLLQSLFAIAALGGVLLADKKGPKTVYKHVAAISIDGLHSSDMPKRRATVICMIVLFQALPEISKQTKTKDLSQLTTEQSQRNRLLRSSSRPAMNLPTHLCASDLFPGAIIYSRVQSPRTHGVWYDGPAGAEVAFNESKDYDSTLEGLRKVQWADATGHPAYDLAGKGLSIGYFPEIAAIPVTTDTTIAYDKLHVNAFIGWIMNGTTPEHSEIQEKLTGKTSGYVAKTLDFTPQPLKALDFVDASLGQVVAALKARGVNDETLIVVASKHGQAPIAQRKTAVAGLNKQREALKIEDIIYGDRVVDLGYGNPLTDSAVPDIIVRPTEGIIYTTSTAKIAEHGGINADDRKVACFVSAPGLKKTKVNQNGVQLAVF
ncbi:hypothetical protein VC83_07444 [Pseudogymnoascus destructans]|uniref:Type I phosphodiesterase/nucleotide pyrophosphatase n=1 Tax=Pseudogymnoascus destructans TaxID=655981 RepID=A0A177A3T9_9PEZI|nr:uncharacterized protein VC83_07444 [Pseudogymnoascus destructans]OAF56132.1 hypothetical protein VC83_07444 [Pseudogymnoascus destructans]